MRQYQGIGQAMGDMEVAAQRIGQRMHRCHRRIGECLTGQARTEQHGLAGLAVTAVVHRLVKVAGQQAQRLTGQ
ncbi:hypothetical protein D3C76_1135680 [compost metagenome]